MYAAALPLALTYGALWNPPHWGPQALFYYLLGMAIMIRTFVSFYEVPSSALSAEFTNDYDERSSLLSFRFFFGWIGGLSISVFTFAVLLKPDALHAVGQLNPAGYIRYGLLAAVLMFVSILVSAAGTHRHIRTLRLPPAKRNLTLRQTLGEIRETLSNRSFLFLLSASVMTAMATGLGASLNNYFNTYFWQFSAEQISLLVAGVFVSAFVALFAAPVLSRRLGKRTTVISMIVISLLVLIGPMIARLLDLLPANGTPQLLAIVFATSVVGVSFGIVAQVTFSSMIADVVEVAELDTGRRSEGLFFASAAFVQKAVSGFGILTAALVIDAVGLKTGADPRTVPPEVVRNLALIYSSALLGLYACAITLIFGYKITRSSHYDTLAQLAANAEQTAHPV
jgi:Na+/melibiose symporter-like transporter